MTETLTHQMRKWMEKLMKNALKELGSVVSITNKRVERASAQQREMVKRS